MNGYTSNSYFHAPGDPELHCGERSDYGRQDREGSVSGSETSSNYHHYFHGLKDDADPADDPHLSLTSQTLNADGSPKRPMNAFMIFARKRRPEISAANQMMRTGDVSKILSREWNTMTMSEKKFYLDQAKKLKDNFNSKYPDYVYRRRPNNSRKKRKLDAEHDGSQEHTHMLDREDATIEELSPVSSDDLPMNPSSPGYHAPPHISSNHASLHGQNDYGLPHSSYGYATEGSGSMSPSRYDQPRVSQSLPSSTQYGIVAGGVATQRLRSAMDDMSASSGYQTPLFHPEHSPSSSPHSSWSFSREGGRPDQGRTSYHLLSALDPATARQRSGDSSNMSTMKAEGYSPPLTHRSWPNAPAIPSTSSGTSSSRYAQASFPTLTSAFIPNQSPSQRSADIISSSSHQNTGQDYSPSHRLNRGISSADRHYELHRGFTESNVLPLPISNAYVPVGEPPMSQWQPQSRNVPSSQSLESITLPLSTLTSPSGPFSTQPGSGSDSSAQMGYWERDRVEER